MSLIDVSGLRYSILSYFYTRVIDMALALLKCVQHNLANYIWCNEHAIGFISILGDGPLLLYSLLIRGNHLLELM